MCVCVCVCVGGGGGASKYKGQVGYSAVNHEKSLYNYFIPRHRNSGGNPLRAMIHGNVGWYTAEYTTAFLHSDWLYFLWRGINNVSCRDILNAVKMSGACACGSCKRDLVFQCPLADVHPQLVVIIHSLHLCFLVQK